MSRQSALTGAQRQQALRDSRRQQGLKEIRNLWCHPADEAAVRELAANLAQRRGRSEAASRGPG